jgi:predicted esterase
VKVHGYLLSLLTQQGLEMKLKFLGFLCAVAQCLAAHADPVGATFSDLDLGQSSKKLPVYQVLVPDAKVNFVVLPGGSAGFGKLVDGVPSSKNSLVRMQPLFAQAGASTFAMFRPRGMTQDEMSYEYRLTDEHMEELRAVIRDIRSKSKAPIWLIGTSRGTVSATRAALVMPDEIAGIVLTASVVKKTAGNVSSQPIEQIQKPVLMVHHIWDRCPVCPHDEAKALIQRFTGSSRAAFVSIESGSDPQEGVCGPLHWHGFPGAEQEVVDRVMKWVTASN